MRLAGNKLMIHWVGPFRVVEALSHSFIIEHFIRSRLKLYADSSLEITEELVQHVSNQGLVLIVEKFCDFCFNDQLSHWELERLEEAENSWEGLEELFDDVPAKMAEFVAASNHAGLLADLEALHE
ncbi:hypothetical protein PHMEG_00016045 [Phytophthora megakarya]|uniref:Uncharacterized protein n=1 Tax=Phytophthora megakarya TaxID=4795 RepID=A0A225W2B2_9STRA|nr:hypothetical protein PHMEG_00016045 [Phytophthora megakarya]